MVRSDLSPDLLQLQLLQRGVHPSVKVSCVDYSFAKMFLCPLETLHFILLVNQLSIGTASERPAQSSATPEDCLQSHGVVMA